MSLVLTQDQVRTVDRIAIEQFGIPGVVLMENAGRGCAELLNARLTAERPQQPVTIVAGKGNNAGDGFVIARFLDNWNIRVRILLCSSPDQLSGDAAINWRIVEKMRIPFLSIHSLDELEEKEGGHWLQESSWIVDALLGTGLKGEVREPVRSVIAWINTVRNGEQKAGTKVLAVDIPSGLHCDTGEILGEAVEADLTATFVASKPGLLKAEGPVHAGEIHVIDIGVPRAVIEQVETD